ATTEIYTLSLHDALPISQGDGMRGALLLLAMLGAPLAHAADASPDAAALYAQHCAACHSPDRFGAMGPALLPQNLARLRRAETRSEEHTSELQSRENLVC